MKETAAEASGVLVLHKTLDILETIKETQEGLRLADLARSVDMPKATVYRILTTLEARGYVDRAEDGGYRLAKKLFDMQRTVPFERILTEAAQPFMEQLAASSKETVNLGILDAGDVVVINTVESQQAVRMSSKIGNRRYLHATALGKVLLAWMPAKEAERLLRLKGLPRVTPHTLVTKSAVLAELQKIRQQGYALDNQENEIEGRCLGAPITGPGDRVVAALSVSGPEFRMDVERAHSIAPELKKICAGISEAVRS